jgi:hypothetical protein
LPLPGPSPSLLARLVARFAETSESEERSPSDSLVFRLMKSIW